MKYLLIAALLFTACSKSDDKEIQSATGVWYVNGVAHTPDTVRRWGFNEISAVKDQHYSLSLFFSSIPMSNHIDTIATIDGPNRVVVTLRDGGKIYSSQNTTQEVTSTHSNGKMIFTIPEVTLKSNAGQMASVSGTIIYDLP